MGRRFDRASRQRLLDRLAQGLGDSQSDLVYTPVEPCRVFDSRSALLGGLSPNTPRDFLVAGDAGFASPGGAASGCGVPLGPATSVVLNLAVVTPAGPGNLRAWAVSDPQKPAPLASVLNFGSIAGLPALANGLVLPICDRASVGGTCPSDLRIQADVSGTQVVGDVVGYFRSVDLTAEILVGADGFGPVALTGDNFMVAGTSVLTPGRSVQCAITCSVSVASAAANVSGSASLQGGAQLEGTVNTIWGGALMPLPLVSAAGSSTVTQSTNVSLGVGLRFLFGCHVDSTGDFLGDTAHGTVSWMCR